MAGRQRTSKRRYPQRRRERGKGATVPDLHAVRGILQVEADGSGRIYSSDPRAKDVHLSRDEVGKAKSGDRVRVQPEVGRRGRIHGRILECSAPGAVLVGVVEGQGRHRRIHHEPKGPTFALDAGVQSNARTGDAVVFELSSRNRGEPLGRITEVLGKALSPAVQVHMLLRQLGLPLAFDRSVDAAALVLPDVDTDRILLGARRDLRGICHVTIDGADARDFDDAVSAQVQGESIRIWVSIADVAHYVTPGGVLDAQARERGTSVYLPGRVLPMLPERLSNDLCSLRPNEPRLTLTCEFSVDRRGRCSQTEVYPSLIQSKARLTYEEVQGVLEGRGRWQRVPTRQCLSTCGRQVSGCDSIAPPGAGWTLMCLNRRLWLMVRG
ncbi:MAG: RNB domain-containing ribonuclease [Myxococcota bacterium]